MSTRIIYEFYSILSMAVFRQIYIMLMFVSNVNSNQHAFNNIYEIKFNTYYMC